jgi:hypothetical protein
VSLQEKEITRWDLIDVAIADVYRSVRDATIQLWWTPIEELDAFVLNIFSPLGAVFWNFASYKAAGDGAFKYAQRLVKDERTRSILNKIILEVGAERRSEFSSNLLGGFTRFFGDSYQPQLQTQPPFLSAHRHLSIAVPASCQGAISRYFNRQLVVFKNTATKQCPEEVSLVLTGASHNEPLFGLLCKAVGTMSDGERDAHLYTTRSGHSPLATDEPSHLKYTGNSGISISPVGVGRESKWLNVFEEISRFRVESAISHFSLSGAVKLKCELDDERWSPLWLAGLREEFRGRLASTLAHYPIVETNPFELA